MKPSPILMFLGILLVAPVSEAEDNYAKGTAKAAGKTAGHAARDGARTAGRTVRDFFTKGPKAAEATAKTNAAETKTNAKANAAETKKQAQGK